MTWLHHLSNGTVEMAIAISESPSFFSIMADLFSTRTHCTARPHHISIPAGPIVFHSCHRSRDCMIELGARPQTRFRLSGSNDCGYSTDLIDMSGQNPKTSTGLVVFKSLFAVTA